MPDSHANDTFAPEWILPAWGFSVVLHCGLILFLGIAVDRSTRGAAEEPVRSAGIVLKTTSAAGELYEGEERAADNSALAASDAGTAEQLLAALPTASPLASSKNADATEPVPGLGMIAQGGVADASQFLSGGGRRGSLGGGGDASVSVFGVYGSGNKFVYLFDRSSSMEGRPLAAAKRQLIESLDALESIHQFHIIFFNTRTMAFDITGGGRRVAFASERNKQLAEKFVGGITADGGTDRLIALREALSFSPDVVFFLTDADDPMPPNELEEVAQTNRRAQAAICVIEFGRVPSPAAGNFLSRIAHESGGQYGYVNATGL